MYGVMLFHDDNYRSCAKSELFHSFSDALVFFASRISPGDEYESALIYHTGIPILLYSRTGAEK